MDQFNENFNIIANMSLKESGISYNVNTIKNKKYKFIICGFIKTGTFASIFLNKINSGYQIDKTHAMKEIEFEGNGNIINIGILFLDNKIRNVLKIFFIGILDEDYNVVEIGNLYKQNKPKICQYPSMNYWNIYSQFIKLNKKKILIVEKQNDTQEIFNIFDESFIKILVKSNIDMGHIDNDVFILPSNIYKNYLIGLKSDIYYIK